MRGFTLTYSLFVSFWFWFPIYLWGKCEIPEQSKHRPINNDWVFNKNRKKVGKTYITIKLSVYVQFLITLKMQTWKPFFYLILGGRPNFVILLFFYPPVILTLHRILKVQYMLICYATAELTRNTQAPRNYSSSANFILKTYIYQHSFSRLHQLL